MSGVLQESETYESACGRPIFRRVYLPDGGWGAVRGAVVLVHGLGDHSGRYEAVAAPFVERGLALGGVDLPGHGRSSGRRGDFAGVGVTRFLFDEVIEWLAGRCGGRGAVVGMAAHSMGAFLAMHYLMFGGGRFRFVWLNGMLVDVGWGQPWWRPLMARLLAGVAPGFCVGHGVTADRCSHLEADDDPLKHRWISLRVARALLVEGARLRRGLGSALGGEGMALLMTHGGEDPACPVSLAREFYEQLAIEDKAFVELEGGLHETFRDTVADELFAELGGWLDRVWR